MNPKVERFVRVCRAKVETKLTKGTVTGSEYCRWLLAAEPSRVEQRGGVLELSARAAANCEMWREKVFIVASIRRSLRCRARAVECG